METFITDDILAELRANGIHPPLIAKTRNAATGADMLRARRIHVRTTSQATLPTIVIGSDLVATGSAWLFQQYACVMPLKVVTAPFARNWNTVLAQWPRHRQTPMVNWFVDQIRARHGHLNVGK